MKGLSIGKQLGETIVEVLIAIMVLGVVLGTTMGIVTRSQKQVQANHEFHQAQLFANQQAELILSAYDNFVATEGYGKKTDFLTNVVIGPDPFCYTEATPPTKYADSDPECVKNERYKISVNKIIEGGLPGGSFRILITWDSLSSSGEGRVELIYAI